MSAADPPADLAREYLFRPAERPAPSRSRLVAEHRPVLATDLVLSGVIEEAMAGGRDWRSVAGAACGIHHRRPA